MKKKILSLFLCVLLCLTMIPMTAVFAAEEPGTETYEVTIRIVGNGLVQKAGGMYATRYHDGDVLQFAAGKEVTLYADPPAGSIFSGATSDDVTIKDGGSVCRYFTMPEKDVTITFTFEEDDTPPAPTYKVSFDANGGSGTMSTVTVNESQYAWPSRCSFTPPEGKVFAGWSLSAGGEKITSKLTLTEDITLYALWDDPYNVTIRIVGNGKVQQSGGMSAPRYEDGTVLQFAAGKEVTLYADPPAGSIFSGATSDDVTINNGGSVCRYFTMPEKDVTVTFKFTGSCAHENTEIKNQVSANGFNTGYSGDTHCADCGEKIAEGVVTYDVFVENVQVTAANKENVLGDGKVSFDPDSRTLTLNNAAISNTNNPGIRASGASNIFVVGNASINSNTSNGIVSDNSVAISGDGKLTVKSGVHSIVSISGDVSVSCPVDITSSFGYAFNAAGNVTINNTLEIVEPIDAVIDEGKIKVGEKVAEHVVIAEKEVEKYVVWVGGTQVTSDNKDDVLGDGKVSYDPDSKTLTLASGTVINYSGDEGAIIYKPAYVGGGYGTFYLNMLGDVKIISSGSGIQVSNTDLTITGNGDLDITSNSYGISSPSSLIISNSGDVNITVKGDDGIHATFDVTIDGNVNITAAGECDNAIYTLNRICINGNVNITGSETGSFNEGLNATYSGSSIEVTGNVTSTTKTSGLYASGGSKGIVVGGNVDITVTDESANAINYDLGSYSVSIDGEAKITGANSEAAITTGGANISIGGDLTVSGFKNGLITNTGTITMQAKKTWDISTTETAVSGKEININDNQITLPEDGIIGTYGEGEAILEADGTTPAKHVVIELICLHTNTEIRNAVEATCTEEGYTGDTYCKDCDKLLDEGIVVAVKGHDYKFDIHDPTCTEDGYQIITCSSCDYELKVTAGVAYGHHDEDLDGKCDICDADMSVEYEMISGDGSEWTKGSEDTLTFVSAAEFAQFDSVKVDDENVADTAYIAMAGSTKIELSAEYLETLSVGTHTLTIVSTNGIATGEFTVKEEVAPTPGGDEEDPTPTPGGDEENPTPTPGGDEEDPTPAPGGDEEDPTPIPGGDEENSTPTPGGDEGTPTPTPGEDEDNPTPTPGGEKEEVTPAPSDKPADTPADKPSDATDNKPADNTANNPDAENQPSENHPAAPTTGDHTNLVVLLGLAIISAGVLGLMSYKRREN